MICKACGRKLPDGAEICKGCGAQLERVRRPKPDRFADVMKRTVKLGAREVDTWRICVSSCCAVLLLTLGYFFVPQLWSMASAKVSQIKDAVNQPETIITEQEPVKQRAPVDGEISGEVLDVSLTLKDTEIVSDTMYDDGSWERDMIVKGDVRMRFIRFEPQVDWTNTHLRMLYPDVSELESFPELPLVSGYSGSRFQISSTAEAEGCVVELMMVKTPSFDHFFIIEVSTESFFDYEAAIDDWMSHLVIVDAQTREELPAAAISDSDISGSDALD